MSRQFSIILPIYFSFQKKRFRLKNITTLAKFVFKNTKLFPFANFPRATNNNSVYSFSKEIEHFPITVNRKTLGKLYIFYHFPDHDEQTKTVRDNQHERRNSQSNSLRL